MYLAELLTPAPVGDRSAPGHGSRRIMSAPTQLLTHRIIELACLAPSVHNTQPWRWRIRNDHLIELWADRDRQLRVADPEGRNLAISCGAALHHFIVASGALGAISTVELTPVSAEPDLLAIIRLSPGPAAADAAESLEVLARRRTDRRRFTSWPVPESRLAHLTRAAAGWGAYAIPILDVAARFHTELLLSRASTMQRSDPRLAEEQRTWTERSSVDGVPSTNASPPSRARTPERPNRFAAQPPTDITDALVESSDGSGRGLHRHGRPAIVAGGRAGAQRPVVAGHGRWVVARAAEPGDRGGRDQTGPVITTSSPAWRTRRSSCASAGRRSRAPASIPARAAR